MSLMDAKAKKLKYYLCQARMGAVTSLLYLTTNQ